MEVTDIPVRANTMTADPFGNENALADSAPLVSVIIRTMARDELAAALDSVAGQTYRNIEVILCDARGLGEMPSQDRCGEFPVRIASTGTPLGRGAAANVGLDAAGGNYVVFLDDDDWFLPDHIASLVGAVASAAGAAAAYSGIACKTKSEAGDWESVYIFNQPWDPVRLLVENYLPMHLVLFSRKLVGDDLRFDESMEVYEDWDFWIQLSSLTDLVHVDRVTAIYRVAEGSGFGVRVADPAADAGKAVLLDKWRLRWSLDQVLKLSDYAKYHSMYYELIRDHERSDNHNLAVEIERDAQLAERDAQLTELNAHFAELKSALSVREGQVQELTQSLRDFDDAHNRHVAHLGSTVDELRRRTAALEQSTFWRATAPCPGRSSRSDVWASGSKPLVAEEGVRGLVDETCRRAQVRREGPSTEPPPDSYRPESEIWALNIPSHAEREMSIVVPTYGQHRVTFTCLPQEHRGQHRRAGLRSSVGR